MVHFVNNACCGFNAATGPCLGNRMRNNLSHIFHILPALSARKFLFARNLKNDAYPVNDNQAERVNPMSLSDNFIVISSAPEFQYIRASHLAVNRSSTPDHGA